MIEAPLIIAAVQEPPERAGAASLLPTPSPTPETPQAASPQAVEVSGSEADAKAFIYEHESGNNPGAMNSSSGACSLGQALPCSKLAAACPNWQTDYACDDSWFTSYMEQRYSTWPNAQAFWLAHSWW